MSLNYQESADDWESSAINAIGVDWTDNPMAVPDALSATAFALVAISQRLRVIADNQLN